MSRSCLSLFFFPWNLQNNEHGGEGEERRQNVTSPRLAGTPTAPYSSLEKGGPVSPVRSITPEVIQVGRFFTVLHSVLARQASNNALFLRSRYFAFARRRSRIEKYRRGEKFIYLFFFKYNRQVWKFSYIEYFVARGLKNRKRTFFVKIFDAKKKKKKKKRRKFPSDILKVGKLGNWRFYKKSEARKVSKRFILRVSCYLKGEKNRRDWCSRKN